MSKKLTEHVLEWSNALRSGKYKQTKDTLEREGAYCCLGVACVVAGDPTLWNSFLTDHQSKTKKRFGLEDGGFRSSNEALQDDHREPPLATDLNDLMDLSFEQIAYLIDEEYAKQQGIYDNEG